MSFVLYSFIQNSQFYDKQTSVYINVSLSFHTKYFRWDFYSNYKYRKYTISDNLYYCQNLTKNRLLLLNCRYY